MTRSIAILIPFFGDWPPWMNFFVESCRANSSIDWIIFGDAPPPENRARNVRHVQTTFAAYRDELSRKLGAAVAIEAPYKLCDIRPALAFVHADLVRNYDFVGFGDIDVIYGNIRAFYDDAALDRYDLLSSHADRVSGHFCLMRNSPDMVTAFRDARGWKQAIGVPEYVNFDERGFYNHVRGKRGRLLKPRPIPNPCHFRELYSTPGVTNEMRWYWRDGRLTNEHYPLHPFMYLHFMSWHNNRWYEGQPGVSPARRRRGTGSTDRADGLARREAGRIHDQPGGNPADRAARLSLTRARPRGAVARGRIRALPARS